MAIMSAKRVRQLPVIRDGELLGIISIGDLVKSVITDREFVIEQLEHYIRKAHLRMSERFRCAVRLITRRVDYERRPADQSRNGEAFP